MKTVDDHLADILASVDPLPARTLSLDEAYGTVLAKDVHAGASLPGFDNSAMDGYAVRRADLAAASPERPVTLPVIGDVPAGAAALPTITRGTVARIMTGAPLPPGADAVVPLEWTDGRTDWITIARAPADGQCVRRAGEDVIAGACVLAAGSLLSAARIGLLAAVGRGTVLAHPRPRVGVLSTGSELIDAGRPLGAGQVADSNSHALAAAARSAGADADRVGLVHDDPAVLRATLDSKLGHLDALVTTGGVSVGAYDVVKEVLTGLGTVAFERVAMQPGMPQGFGLLHGVPIFTLPGNPVSALVSFEIFVRPALRVLRGLPALDPARVVEVELDSPEPMRSPAGKRSFLRVTLDRADRDPGTARAARTPPTARPAGGQGSHQLAALAAADALLVVPEDLTEVGSGARFDALLLEGGRAV